MKQLLKKNRKKEKATPKTICGSCKYFIGLNPFMEDNSPIALCCPLGFSNLAQKCDPWEDANMKYCYCPQSK